MQFTPCSNNDQHHQFYMQVLDDGDAGLFVLRPYMSVHNNQEVCVSGGEDDKLQLLSCYEEDSIAAAAKWKILSGKIVHAGSNYLKCMERNVSISTSARVQVCNEEDKNHYISIIPFNGEHSLVTFNTESSVYLYGGSNGCGSDIVYSKFQINGYSAVLTADTHLEFMVCYIL